MNIIYKTIFGSHLYGFSSINSDHDYKGIYLPDIKDLILQHTSKSMSFNTNNSNIKNTVDDIDEEYYSLHYFLNLAFNGETVALDMLHVKPEFNLSPGNVNDTHLFEFLYKHRSRFYTKKMKAFIGYAVSQSIKYGRRGERLEGALLALDYIHQFDDNMRIIDIADGFPINSYITKMEIADCQEEEKRCIKVCDKMLMYKTKLKFCKETLQLYVDQYGNRAKLAMENKGVDLKSLTHAFRVCFELKEIYETGDLIFPLRTADYLKQIKFGELKYNDDGLGEKLEDLIDEVKILADNSNYPNKVDVKFWNEWLIEIYSKKSIY